jgi:hypothetical protein
MCDCRKDLRADEEGKVRDFVAKKYKATVKSSDLHEVAFPFVRGEAGISLRSVTYSTLRVETNERKKPVVVDILHSYCPFCGVKYE